MQKPTRDSVLFITLDSCRFDTFEAANVPNFRSIGALYKAQAPGYFTYGSHSAMFVGFLPGVMGTDLPILNPKKAKLFKLIGPASGAHGGEGYTLQGRNIVDGFRRLGFITIGCGAMGWFDPATDTGRHLSDPFEHYTYTGGYALRKQIGFVQQHMADAPGAVFAFINVGETHVPYWHEGADWSADDNPCLPFQTVDRAADCRHRQRQCLEFADRELAELVSAFADSTIVVCGDHGDCWGEDGLWEHGVSHWATLTVPLMLRVRGEPVRHVVAAQSVNADVNSTPIWKRLVRSMGSN